MVLLFTKWMQKAWDRCRCQEEFIVWPIKGSVPIVGRDTIRCGNFAVRAWTDRDGWKERLCHSCCAARATRRKASA